MKSDKGSWFDFWCENTTCHGISDWYNSGTRGEKVVWSLLILASLSVCLWQTSSLVMDFAQGRKKYKSLKKIQHKSAPQKCSQVKKIIPRLTSIPG